MIGAHGTRRQTVFRILFSTLVLVWLLPAFGLAQSIPGDANNDGRFGAADIEAIVTTILETGSPPGNPDCTANGGVDVRDVVCVTNLIAATVPSIAGFSPTSAQSGTLVTLTGSHLTQPNGVPVRVSLLRLGGGVLEAPITTASSNSLAFVVPPGATTGPVTVTALERPPAISAQPLVINVSSSFVLTAAPAAVSLIRGESAAFAISLQSGNGFTQLVTLGLSGLPDGVTGVFTPARITSGQTAILRLDAGPAAGLGSASLTISASATVEGTALLETANVSLTVLPITTSFRGRTVVADALETPLAGVTVTALGVDGNGNSTGCVGQSVSDAAGNFALIDLPPACVGGQLIRYDGTTVTAPAGLYAGVDKFYELVAGQVATPPVLIHLPRIDDQPTALVQQNVPFDQHFTFDRIPNLSVTVYAGTTLRLADGSEPNPFPLTAVDVPVDRLPDQAPSPPDALASFIVAFQPANAVASQPVAVYFPNLLNVLPGLSMTLSTLDPTQGIMVTYGTGVVSPDGRQIVPDYDPAHPGHRYGLVHFDWHGPMQPPPPRVNPAPPGAGPCPEGVKPIDPVSGIEILQETDIVIPGTRGDVEIRRTYRTLSAETGPFGIGTSHNFSYRLDTNSPVGAGLVNLILPDGNRIPFVRGPDGLLRNGTVPSFAGATLATPSGGPFILRFKDGTVYRFTPSTFLLGSLLQSIADPRNNRITLARDVSRPIRITEITDPVGRRLRLDYDTGDRILAITDPIGRVVSYTYNAQGALESVVDPAGEVTFYTYDPQNRLRTVTDARGIVVAQNSYDANGRAVQQIQGDGGIWDFEYTLANPQVPSSPVLETRITNPERHATVYRFNPQGFLLSVTDALGQTRVFEREQGTNRLLSLRGTANCAPCGSSAAGGDMFFTYDTSGNISSITDALGATTSFTYEPSFQKLASITNALGHTSTFSYDATGLLTSSTDARGKTTTYEHDGAGQLESITDPLGQTVTFTHDGFGNPIQITNAVGQTTSWIFDAVSRPEEQIDPLSRRTLFSYDALNRISTITDAKGNDTSFTYDEVGNLLSVTDARGNTTSFTYDALNRTLTRTDSLGAVSTWQYDHNGNVRRFVDRRNLESLFVYDALDRLTSETYSDSLVTRVYDPRGRLIEVADSLGGNHRFEYDLVGRLVRSLSPVGVVDYVRDPLGRVARRQVVGLDPVDYTYDEIGNLLTAALPQMAVGFTYDDRNQLVHMTRSNGVNTDYSYDPAGRLLALIHATATTTLNAQSYTYDAVGNRASYTTDIPQPLTTPPSVNSYDALSNRLLQWGDTAYTYDGEGNRTTATSPEGLTTYAWDSRGRLAALALPTGEAQTFRYDFAGNLITQTSTRPGDPLVRTFVVDEVTNVVATAEKGVLSSILTGQAFDQHYGIVRPGGNELYRLEDALNSTTRVADAAASSVGVFSYQPFGHVTRQQGDLPFLFTGRLRIDDGLHYYRSRFLDSVSSAFLSEDRLGLEAGDANLYRYVFNNPTNLVDPSGEFVPLLVVAAAAGAYIVYDVVKKARNFWDAAEAYRESNEACVQLVNATSDCDQEELLRKCQEGGRNLVKALGAGVRLGASIPGTSFSGPVPTSKTDLIVGAGQSLLFSAGGSDQ